jgi:uncharacterized protein YjbJ (UPF0337 family)
MTDFKDKLLNTKDKIVGEVKEAIGKATNNEELEFEGKMQSTKADFNQKVNEVKDDISEKTDDVYDKFVDNSEKDRVLDREKDYLNRNDTSLDNTTSDDMGTVYDKNIVGDMGAGIDTNRTDLKTDLDNITADKDIDLDPNFHDENDFKDGNK